MARLIFITGGVVSSLGKGLASAALGALLQARGYKVRLRKLDPYLNVDPGTMSPFQHGEVYVTDDGAETDLDLGHYERFTGVSSRRADNITSGRIYQQVIEKERNGEYLGRTVQVIPHVTDMIKEFVMAGADEVDFLLCEIGGTVGDIEGLPFFEAIRQLGNELGREHVAFVHLTLVPYLEAAGELKTKPTQHSVKELRAIGIQPDILLCRSEKPLPDDDRRKIGLFCNVPAQRVIPALDLRHHLPRAAGLSRCRPRHRNPQRLRHQGRAAARSFQMEEGGGPGEEPRRRSAHRGRRQIHAGEGFLQIAVGSAGPWRARQQCARADGMDRQPRSSSAPMRRHSWKDVNGILVPGGFGERGTEGKIQAVKFARERDVPFFGICYGLHMAVIEAARDLAGLEGAGTTENRPAAPSRDRADDRMDQRQPCRNARRRQRSGRHDAAGRLSPRC